MRDPVAEALSRIRSHHYLPPATPGPWAGSRSPTLPFPPHRRASRQDTRTPATVSTVGVQAASTARVSKETEGQDGSLRGVSFHRFDSTRNTKLSNQSTPDASVTHANASVVFNSRHWVECAF